MDLYTDEQINGRHRVRKEERRASQGGAPVPAVKAHSNGVASPSSCSPHAALPAREDVHVSTLNCQLTKMSVLEPDVANSARAKEGKRPREESAFTKDDGQSQSQQAEPAALGNSAAEADAFCTCLQSPEVSLKLCIECNTLHNVSCALLQDCIVQSHSIALPGPTDQSSEGSSAASPDASPAIRQPLKPMPFHYCCDLSQLDPQLLCLTCGVFHSCSCREIDLCQSLHQVKRLGVCACGSTCSRKPLVLCHYCGSEYCLPCWFRSPVICACGQTFDQSPV